MQYCSPYTASTRWMRGNLHTHTCCGRFMDLSESGRMYARLGYDFLAITDHNKTHDANQIDGWRQAAGLVVMPGEENGAVDHIIELGVHEVTPTPEKDYARRVQAMRDAGAFVIAAHPQERPTGEQDVRSAAEHLHAIEIYNGLRELRGTDETRNVTLWDQLLTQGHRLWAVAADDFHCQYNSPAHGWVVVQMPEDDAAVTWQGLIEQLKRGAFYASTGPSFEKLQLHDGQLHVAAGKRCTIQIVGPGGEVLARSDEPELTWNVDKGLPYFRAEIHRGIKRAWSQPFFAQ